MKLPGFPRPIGEPFFYALNNYKSRFPSGHFLSRNRLVISRIFPGRSSREIDDRFFGFGCLFYALRIENGQDYCTLVTCTPYGINTHRLLVRGHRVSDAPTETEPEVYDFTSFLRSPVMIALAIMLVLLLMIYANTHNKRNEAKKR